MKVRPSIYSRPAGKPLFVPVPKRDWRERAISAATLGKPIIVDRSTECHVTPPDVAARMVRHLGAPDGRQVLEPSAGTGNLFRALIAAGYSADCITMVEMHNTLAAILRALGRVEHADFLEFAVDAGTFGAIVMNPPFRRVRQHVAAAVSLLAAGGTLVALVPTTFDAKGFRTLETLPETTFATAAVRTKIIIKDAMR